MEIRGSLPKLLENPSMLAINSFSEFVSFKKGAGMTDFSKAIPRNSFFAL